MGMMGASDVNPFSREQQFITSGTYEFVVPKGVKGIKALVIGGGAKGKTNGVATGGKGGGVISGIIKVRPGDILSIAVGAVLENVGGTSAITRAGDVLLQGNGGTNAARGGTAYAELVTLLSNYNATSLPTAGYKGCRSFLEMADDAWAFHPGFWAGGNGGGYSSAYGATKGSSGKLGTGGYGIGGTGGTGGLNDYAKTYGENGGGEFGGGG